MGLKIVGFITVEIDKEEIEISGEDFSLEEANIRHIGDGDSQYEALFVYRNDENQFTVSIQATDLDGEITLYSPTIDGKGRITSDKLEAVQC